MKKRPRSPRLAAGRYLIDSHCHLDMDDYRDRLDQTVAEAKEAGVVRIITIGIDLASSRRALALARQYPSVIYATVGIHPHNAEQLDDNSCRELKELCTAPEVVGYGEIGLDYAKQYAPVDIQQTAFARQLELAKDVRLPVIIHDREAHRDSIALLEEHGPYPAGGVMHCFSGDIALARQVLKLGFYISIPGIVTFKNAQQLQQVAATVPLENLILETDGPFLAPVPWRGKTNQPAYLPFTAACVARLKKISLEEVAEVTSANTERLFGLPEGVAA